MSKKMVISQEYATKEQLQYLYKNDFTPEKNLRKPTQEAILREG